MRSLPVVLALAALAVPAARADVPIAMHFQGQLLDASGEPLAGPVPLWLSVWGSPASTAIEALRYEEEHASVELVEGRYDVLLGRGTPIRGELSAELFARPSWLEIRVGDETLEPRIELVSVPYALLAHEAEQLAGHPADAFQQRVTGSCAVGSYVTSVNADGSVECDGGDPASVAVVPPLQGNGADASPLGLVPGGVDGTHIAPDAIDGSKVANGSIGSSDIAPSSIQAGHIQTGAVGTLDILNESILNVDIQVGAVRTSEIQDGEVRNQDLANNSVTASKIASGAVGASEIASGAVRSAEIATNAVTNSKLNLSLGYYTWTASNGSPSWTANIGSGWEFCAVTGVSAGSSTSSAELTHFVCAVYPSGLPGSDAWILESHGNRLTSCRVRCF